MPHGRKQDEKHAAQRTASFGFVPTPRAERASLQLIGWQHLRAAGVRAEAPSRAIFLWERSRTPVQLHRPPPSCARKESTPDELRVGGRDENPCLRWCDPASPITPANRRFRFDSGECAAYAVIGQSNNHGGRRAAPQAAIRYAIIRSTDIIRLPPFRRFRPPQTRLPHEKASSARIRAGWRSPCAGS